MSTLKCQDCGHENETQRVYCHNCGAKLDRASLIAASKNPPKVVKPKSNSQSGKKLGGFIGGLIKTAFFAGIFACLIEAARPPLGAPSGEKQLGGDIIDAPSLSVELDEALTNQRRIGYNEAQLNAYLKNKVRAPKNPQIPAWAITFDSAYVKLLPGSFQITKKYLLLSQPVFIGGTYVPLPDGKTFKVKTIGGNVGSLPLPGLLFDQVDEFIFDDFIKGMKEEAGSAGKMKSIEISPKSVIITPGPAR